MQDEKLYHTMNQSGIMSITTGIVLIAVSVAAGVLMIVSGAKLLVRKNEMMI